MESNKKIKVLVVPSDTTGVGTYRSINPHLALSKNYPDEFHVDIDFKPNLENDEWLKQYDIIHYHRSLGSFEKTATFLDKLDDLGITSIMDLDDYWSPGPHHPAYLMIKDSKMDIKILDNIKSARNVTTTTDVFANEIRKYNKNVYVLPNAINPEEKQYIPSPEKSDRVRFGWLGGSCYDDKTEILTNEGWKLFKDLNKNEEVLTLNPNNNKIEYQKPIRYIDEEYKGKVNIGKNRLIDYTVTPNHNMYVSRVKNLTHKKLDYKLIHSEDVHGENLHFKRDGIWEKEEIEYFSITNENGDEVQRFEMDDWLKFFGFWLADGWTSNVNYGYQSGICQFKDNDYLSVINSIMEKYGYKPYINADNTQYRYCNKDLWYYLSQFGKANEKFIPRTLLNNLNKRQLNILLDWYLKGDGHIENNKYSRSRAWSVSKKLAGDLQELALKIGIAATIINRGKSKSVLNERLIEGKHDCYQIGFSKHPNESKHNQLNPLLRAEDQYEVEYDGRIYCVEVPNHILYIRRNGKAFWCGNSHKRDLQLLDGVVNRLSSDGLIDKIQFVLCGFDTRGTITMIDQKSGQKTQRPIKPMESVWYEYEKIFTNNYTSISPEYKKHLMKFVKDEFPNVENESYRRVWTKPITTYATNYNLFDVSLAPLEDNIFNRVKSQLKVIEAGFHKKAIIAQEFGPYLIDLEHAMTKGSKREHPKFNETGNALLVDTNKNNSDWYTNIKRLIKNPEMINELSDRLHNTVKDTYNINVVTSNRRELYIKLIGEQKK